MGFALFVLCFLMAIKRNILTNFLNNRALPYITDKIAEGIIYAADFGIKSIMYVKWFPNQWFANRFFENGKLYSFKNDPVWLNLWQDDPGSGGKYRNGPHGQERKPLCRIRPGSILLILGTERLEPDRFILKVLVNEQAGYIMLVGDAAMQPWTIFDRIHTPDIIDDKANNTTMVNRND